jgi:DmsE family decaheme c-type cytochrome
MKSTQRPWLLAALLGFPLLLLARTGRALEAPAPETKAPSAACADCHDEAKAFASNPHSRLPKFSSEAGPNAVCQSCHGDGAKHIDSGGEAGTIRGFHSAADTGFCLSCHTASKDHSSFQAGMHASSATVNCISCHSIHKADPRSPRLLSKAPTALCASCHQAQAASFREKPFAHRLGRGGMECVSCHDPHGRSVRESVKRTASGDLACVNCHAEKRGPFVFEHVNGIAGDCLSCHEAHGSNNPKRLIRARVDQLCLECHSRLSSSTFGSQPPSFHNLNLSRYRNCTTCHVAIHGSNLSPSLLK